MVSFIYDNIVIVIFAKFLKYFSVAVKSLNGYKQMRKVLVRLVATHPELSEISIHKNRPECISCLLKDFFSVNYEEQIWLPVLSFQEFASKVFKIESRDGCFSSSSCCNNQVFERSFDFSLKFDLIENPYLMILANKAANIIRSIDVICREVFIWVPESSYCFLESLYIRIILNRLEFFTRPVLLECCFHLFDDMRILGLSNTHIPLHSGSNGFFG